MIDEDGTSLTHDPLELDQYRSLLRTQRVQREFRIDRLLTGLSDKEYETRIRNSPTVKKYARTVTDYRTPTYSGIATFSNSEYKNYAAVQNTRAIEQYLIDQHDLPRSFFAADAKSAALARSARDNLHSNIPDKHLPIFRDQLCGVFMLASVQPAFNFALGLLIDFYTDDDIEGRKVVNRDKGVFLVRAVAECDQEPRSYVIDLTNITGREPIRPTKYAVKHLRGYAYIERQNFVIVLARQFNANEVRVSIPMAELFMLHGVNEQRYVGQETWVTEVQFEREFWTVDAVQTKAREETKIAMVHGGPHDPRSEQLASLHRTFLAKCNPVLPISGDEDRNALALSPLFNLFLRNFDTSLNTALSELGYAPHRLNDGRLDVDVEYANRMAEYLHRYCKYDGENISNFEMVVKSLYTV